MKYETSRSRLKSGLAQIQKHRRAGAPDNTQTLRLSDFLGDAVGDERNEKILELKLSLNELWMQGNPANFQTEGELGGVPIELDGTAFKGINLHFWAINLQARSSEVTLHHILVDHIGQNQKCSLTLRNCRIGQLVLGHSGTLLMEDCTVDQLLLAGPLDSVEIRGSRIHNLNVQKGDAQLGADVILESVYFARSLKDFPDVNIQGYRDFRDLLSTSGNLLAAGQVHAAELALERQNDTGLFRVVSTLYGWFSNYGNSIVRPLIWWSATLLAMTVIIFIADGAVIPKGTELSGWQTFLEDESSSRVLRAVTMAFQRAGNPLSAILGGATLVASKVCLQILLVVSNLLSATFLVLFLLALRRRFKIG